MSQKQQHVVDQTTSLARNNQIGLVVFQVGTETFYGVNVFKTREIKELKDFNITRIPQAGQLIEGVISLREQMMPLVNLPQWLGISLTPEQEEKSLVVICDFNHTFIGLRVSNIFRIETRSWEEVGKSDGYSFDNEKKVINHIFISGLEQKQTPCFILDIERLLSDISPGLSHKLEEGTAEMKKEGLPEKLQGKVVLIAEDSEVARNHLTRNFDILGIEYRTFENGRLLLDYVKTADLSTVLAVITDLEMPEVSGHIVVAELKKDPRTAHLPVIVNTSMTSDNNEREALDLGADAFIGKTDIKKIVGLLTKLVP